ncbi:MAG: hypothetical protein AMXMBFR83_10800 [Phycisphaerae bacterium]
MASRLVEKTIGSLTIQGHSVAGEETVVIVPEFNVAFDIGRGPREAVLMDTLCLTHGHMDHAAGLAYYFSQRHFQGMPPGTLLVHRKLAPAVEQLMQVWGQIEGHVSPGRIVGVDEDEDFELNRQLVVRPFRVRHPGPCLGFSIVEVRKKLKPEYAACAGPQIAALKKQGQAVEYRLEIPRVAYCGDSMIGNFLDNDHVRNAEVLLFECTFYEAEHVERARLGAHLHVNDLPELMERVRNPHVVLIHVTRRTPLGEAKRAVARILGREDLERVSFLMDQPPRGRTPRPPPDPGPVGRPPEP